MNSHTSIKHFVTLFDSNFLPMGMTLHASLMRHGQQFHLWIICMDELVEEQLERISLPYVTLLPLREVETRELLAVKPGRSRGEYCWTLTPFPFRRCLTGIQTLSGSPTWMRTCSSLPTRTFCSMNRMSLKERLVKMFKSDPHFARIS